MPHTTAAAAREVGQIRLHARTALGVHEAYSLHPLRDSTCIEFGAGRDLIIPLAFSAHGARRFITVDIERLAKLELIRSNATAIISRLSGTSHPDINSLDDLERSWKFDYRAPANARTTDLPAGSIDCAISVETLERIPKNEIAAILKEPRRIMRPGRTDPHAIGYGDHFKGFDPSISSFNFLSYSEED